MVRKNMETMRVNQLLMVIVLVYYLSPGVVSDDSIPIPADKAEAKSWFTSNVEPVANRKNLDPELAKAESNPKRIRVSKDGKGDFATITDALKSVPEDNTQRVIISIGGGNYTERVIIEKEKPFITLYGDPNATPFINFHKTSTKDGIVHSATVIVEADYFTAININILNSAPRWDGTTKGSQAVALTQSGDKAAYYNCKLYGFQDTLCDDEGRHFFKDCYIEGTFDFVFGNGKTLYLDTELHVINGVDGVIAAQARHTHKEDTGFSFVHCKITGPRQGGFLGRGWMAFSRVIYSYTEMTEAVRPLGWHGVPGKPHYGGTAFFGEYKNTGPGANLDGRPYFAKKLNEEEVKPYITLGFIEGSKWLLPPIKLDPHAPSSKSEL